MLNEILNGAYFDNDAETIGNDGTTISAASPKEKSSGEDEYYPARKMDDYSKARSNYLGGYSPFYGGGYPKTAIELTEKKLARIVRESIGKILNEVNSDIYSKNYQISPTGQDSMTGLAKDSIGSNALKNGISGKNLPVYYPKVGKVDVVDSRGNQKWNTEEEAKKEAENGDPTKLNNMGGMATANEVERMYRQARTMSKTQRGTKPDGLKKKANGNGERKDNQKERNQGIITYF